MCRTICMRQCHISEVLILSATSSCLVRTEVLWAHRRVLTACNARAQRAIHTEASNPVAKERSATGSTMLTTAVSGHAGYEEWHCSTQAICHCSAGDVAVTSDLSLTLRGHYCANSANGANNQSCASGHNLAGRS